MKLTAIILAGGKNQRFGRNKALEPIEGKTLIERVINRLTSLTNQILIVTSRLRPDLALDDVEFLADLYPDSGPLGGIYTGLQASRSSYSIAVACDMPFLNVELLHYMVEISDGFDAVVPLLGERMMEPLHAVYSKSCLENMKLRLESNRLSVNSFLKTVRIRYVDKDECQKLDPQLSSFFNINYQSDLDRAIALATKNRH